MNILLSVILGFIVETLIIWVALAIIIYLAKPQFFYPDSGKLDLWVIFWVSLVLALLTTIITMIIGYIAGVGGATKMYGMGGCGEPQPACGQPQPAVVCEKRCEQGVVMVQ